MFADRNTRRRTTPKYRSLSKCTCRFWAFCWLTTAPFKINSMLIALWCLFAQGLIGAFDTLYYHEWRARLPTRGREAAPELAIHAARDFLYGVLFCTLPWLQWRGRWVLLLWAVVICEILLTLWDFVIEVKVRRNLGDVYAGERVTHAVMGILYG